MSRGQAGFRGKGVLRRVWRAGLGFRGKGVLPRVWWVEGPSGGSHCLNGRMYLQGCGGCRIQWVGARA